MNPAIKESESSTTQTQPPVTPNHTNPTAPVTTPNQAPGSQVSPPTKPQTPKVTPKQPLSKQIIPGLTISKKEEKKSKLKKKETEKKLDDEFEWDSVNDAEGKAERKRSSGSANLSPQDTGGRSRSRTTKA